MKYTLEDIQVYRSGNLNRENFSFRASSLSGNADELSSAAISCSGYTVLPGLTDVHVHFREPGFSYKETIATGSHAAAHGGYTTVCAMPNLKPTPDDLASLQQELDAIEKDAVIRVLPYGTITRGELGEMLSDLEGLAPYVCAFTDDGKGVQSEEQMRAAMLEAKRLGKIIVAHCEDNSLLRGGYIHNGIYAALHGHKGICSESEWGPIARDCRLAGETGCAYHVCHVSCKESVAVIRAAKAAGVDVTCETGPHYLLMNDTMLQEEGRFKMNPPIRDESDRLALIEGLKDGTIDMIITDHAPHSAEEKSRGLAGSLMGVVGIETCFPLLYTYLVLPGILTLKQLIDLMYTNPNHRFSLPDNGPDGASPDFTVYDLNREYTVNPDDFLSMGRSTPFEGWKVKGKCVLTVSQGRIAWIDPAFEKKLNSVKGVKE